MGTGLFKTGRFTRNERVKRSSDIKKLFKTGNKVITKGAKFFYLPNQLGINRIAFAIPRGYGNAVQRNKSKRISREVYRYYKMSMKTGFDMILLVYPGNDDFNQRSAQFRSLCQKAGILQSWQSFLKSFVFV